MTNEATILITGSTGSLGTELKKLFPQAICPTHKELDIKDKNSVLDFFKENNFNTIIHTAAITSIRECDENRILAWQTNVEGTKNLVESFNSITQKNNFIYISTACVFQGDQSMYTEESVPYPVNFYALTKLIGEYIVRMVKNHLIIRTNFVPKKTWPYPKAFTDRFGTYLFAKDVAKATQEILAEKLNGTIHLVGDKIFSMYDLAKITTDTVKPMTVKDYEGPHVTMNMTLNTIRWKKYTLDFS